jgi:hypothetical protein
MKKSRKELIKRLHADSHPSYKGEIAKEFPKLFKKDALVSGKWYKNDVGCIFNYNGVKDSDNDACGYGIGCSGAWQEVDQNGWGGRYTLATDKEVGDALIKEAKKRGFKEGVQFIDVVDGELEVVDGNVYQYSLNIDSLTLNSDRIYKNGKWAEILETITKEQAEKELGKTIIN